MDTSTLPDDLSEINFPDSNQTSLFSIPTLCYDNLSLAHLRIDDLNTIPPPWYGWVDEPTITLCLFNLVPLFRCLELSGYTTSIIEFGIATSAGSSFQPPLGWIRVYLNPMTIVFSSSSVIQDKGVLPDPWAASDRLAVRLSISRRISAANQELALPIEAGSVHYPDLCFSSSLFPADYSTLADALRECGIDELVNSMLITLEARWLSFLDGDTLDPFLFTNPPGLLWMFDPAYWDSNPPAWDSSASGYLKNIAGNIRDLISLDPFKFFSNQIDADGDILDLDARIRSLLEQSPNIKPPSSAPYLTLTFFQILHDRNQELGLPLSDYSFTNIAGFSYEQYDSPVRYMELLMHMAQARLFPFPAIADETQPYPYDFEEDPIEVHTIRDSFGADVGLEISVFETAPIRVMQTVYLGYPLEACLSWEYTEPDYYGKSRLVIVAGPGISFQDLQNFPATCSLVIYRVQDFQAVPAWGERIVDINYVGPSDQFSLYVKDLQSYLDLTYDQEQQAENPAEPPVDPAPEAPSQPAFRVRSLEAGVRVTYPAAVPDDEAEFVLAISVDRASANDRYALDIQPAETTGERQRYAVIVFATENVEICVARNTTLISDLYWRVPLAAMPSNGSPLSILPFDLPAGSAPIVGEDEHFSTSCQPNEFLIPVGMVTFTIDLLIGFTPVGDALDLLELLQSFFTGKDKWGQPVTNFDRVFMLGGVLLPFVSGGVLKAVAKRAADTSKILTAVEKAELRLTRVDAMEAAGVTADEIDQLDTLQETLSSPDIAGDAAEGSIRASADLLETSAEKVAQSAIESPAQFGDIISSKGGSFVDQKLNSWLQKWRKGRMKDHELENAIDAWVARQPPGAPARPQLDINNLTDYQQKMDQWIDDLCEWSGANQIDEAVPGSPLDYARGKRAGDPHQLLQNFLGEYYSPFLRGRTPDPRIPPLQRDRWPRLVKRVWPAAGADALNELAGVLTNRAALLQKINDVAAVTRVPVNRFDPDATADFIERLLERYKKNGVFDASCVPDLIGKKAISPEEFIDRMLAGIDMLSDEMDTLGMSERYADILAVPGIESFFEQVLRKSGYEHGFVFEVFLAARALFESIPAPDLWMQVYVNGKMGPDFVRVLRDEDGQALFGRIVQAKSYRDLNQLIGAGGVGEIKDQILRDLKRIAAEGFKVTGPGGEVLSIDDLIEFKIDWAHLRRSEFAIGGIEPAKLHSRDPAVARQVRDAFYNQYLKENVDAINAWLQSAEFRAEFADLDLDPEDIFQNFSLKVDLVDQLLLDTEKLYQ